LKLQNDVNKNENDARRRRHRWQRPTKSLQGFHPVFNPTVNLSEPQEGSQVMLPTTELHHMLHPSQHLKLRQMPCQARAAAPASSSHPLLL
jgi:hypothetical protein